MSEAVFGWISFCFDRGMEVFPEADRRRRTLAEQLASTSAPGNSSSSSPSPNLRDLLKLNQDDIHHHFLQRSFSRRVSLATFLAGEKREVSEASSSPATVRTLLDIIRDEGDYGAANGGGPAASPPVAPAEQPQQARMSLMALLEEADRQGVPPPAPEEKEDEAEEKGTGSRCCVCMVREKGAAFIPCGHTFCRICSRELWISRRNCPLCNALIHEILDIF